MREAGKEITHITSIGGGAKSSFWLQMQADIFNATIRKLNTKRVLVWRCDDCSIWTNGSKVSMNV